LQLRPDYPQAHGNLGHALREQGKLDEAVAHCRRAVELKPDYAEAYNNLGNALRDLDRLDEAIACGRRAVELNPAMADAHNNLGNALKDLGKLDEAIGYFHRALELDPEFAEAHNNLGNVQKEQGNLDEAIACFRRAVELKPDYVEAHSNWLCAMLYSADYAPDAIYREHLRWNERFAAPLAGAIQPHDNDRTPERRLRIGYLSPDFRNHVVALFLLPLLEAHDRGQVEIFCYASVRARDDVTERCRAKADVWRDVFNLSDEQLASMMRQDRIDILVDLAMHTAGSRLLAFARKPAPVQVTYLAYCGTTGMSTIDYRLTDPYLDPPGADERFYSERSIRLPETYWCYRPIVDAPPVNPLPALQNGYITFACFNNFCKVTPPTLAAWRQLLQRVPNSRLLVHAHEGSHRQRVREFIAQEGVSHERITFAGKVPTSAYLRAHQQIDVALDPFPYGGGTTTCDALWMGVPVVSLRGQTAVGRGGASILSNVGLPELVADDIGQYVRIAAELAEDLPRLSKLRTALRERMQHSPLMNAPRFARHVEAAYRTMWQRWCDESNRC
jgi:predicted O-linked N-acetylglucosamine transferase (SPINDLY family)